MNIGTLEMIDRKKKGKYIGWAGAVIVHICIIAILFLASFSRPLPSEESGIPVMIGEASDAGGFSDPSLVDVDIVSQTEPISEMLEDVEQDIITQEDEETVALETEKSEAEKAEEARKQAEEEAERRRQEAEKAAQNKVANAFGKGAQMESSGNATGAGVQGSSAGNASQGAVTGIGGYGTFDLGGRSIGEGGLPRPVYNVQDEGRVVVTITVNPAGEVIATSINRQTNTVNSALRKAAVEAARKARFNAVDGLNNQVGTITYYFNLK